MSGKTGKGSFYRLFRNDKFLIIFSLIISITIWIIIGLTSDEETEVIISDIPITIELSEEAVAEDLEVLDRDLTASVSVKGNKVTVGSLTKSDIQIVAQNTSSISSPGPVTLTLTPKKAGVKTDYEIFELTPSVITVNIDKVRTQEYEIVDNLIYKVKDNYYATTVLDKETVSITGADTSLSKIKRVAIEGTLDGTLDSSQSIVQKLILYDGFGDEINPPFIQMASEEVAANIVVLPKKTLKLKNKFLNNPLGLELEKYIKINPKEIQIAGPKETIDNLDNIVLEPYVDFSEISNKKTVFNFDVKLPADCKNLNNISRVEVEADFSEFKSKKVKATEFKAINLSNDYKAEITTKNLDINIIGTEEQISKIESEDLLVEIDFANRPDGFVGSTEMPVKITPTSSFSSCWAYGNYKANVVISKK